MFLQFTEKRRASLETVLQLFAAFFGFYFLALWVSLVVWTYRDAANRTTDPLVRYLAAILVAIFNLPGLFLYFILRPKETMSEAYERSLEEEALLQGVEGRDNCPVCKYPIREDYLICPNCHTQLKKICSTDGRLLQLEWDICPYCGTPSPVVTIPSPSVVAANPGKRSRR